MVGERGEMKKLRKNQNIYIVPVIVRSTPIFASSLLGFPADLELVWEDGQIGACPVFTNKRVAEKVAREYGCEAEIIKMVTSADNLIKAKPEKTNPGSRKKEGKGS